MDVCAGVEVKDGGVAVCAIIGFYKVLHKCVALTSILQYYLSLLRKWYFKSAYTIGLDKCKIVNISLPTSVNIFSGCVKEPSY